MEAFLLKNYYKLFLILLTLEAIIHNIYKFALGIVSVLPHTIISELTIPIDIYISFVFK